MKGGIVAAAKSHLLDGLDDARRKRRIEEGEEEWF